MSFVPRWRTGLCQNIGYRLAGKIPKRDQNPGLLPASGWNDEHEWGGYLAPDELPRLYNPPSGKIVTANNKMVGDDYPHFLGVEFDPGWRAARLEELLTDKDRYSVRDMEEMQLDTLSKFAQALTPWFTLVNSEDPFEKTALAALRRWNFRMDPEAAAPTVFQYVLVQLLEMVFGDKLGATQNGYLGKSNTPLFLIHGLFMRAQDRLLELLDKFDQSPWYTEATARSADPGYSPTAPTHR
jgi:penicillin amidase